MAARTYTTEEFIGKAVAIHGNKYRYNHPYVGSRQKMIITCPIHGDYQQYPYSHLEGSGCRRCDVDTRATNNTLTHDEFISRVTALHHGKYAYPDQYQHSQQKLTIVCPVHGEFTQLANSHMLGRGCKQCAKENHSGIYNDDYFIAHPHKRAHPAVLYVLRCTYKQRQFIKVGVSVDLPRRLHEHAPLAPVVVNTSPMPLFRAYVTEQRILTELSQHKYHPGIKFDGCTERLVNTDQVIDDIHRIVNDC